MSWKEKLHEIIYEADTRKGKIFDVILLIVIAISIILVMLDSVQSIYDQYHDYFYYAEWIITIIFTIEYILRIICIKKPIKYIFSFYGIVDLLSTLPLYISFFFTTSYALMTLRALRLLRVFRILKITRYIGAGNRLMIALRSSLPKIMIFVFSVVIISFIAGTIMYLVEGPEHGFTSIPVSIYWTIVTLTTVGFGDIHPVTPLGQSIATLIMVLGYGVIAVPTGIVSSEFVQNSNNQTQTQSCFNCNEKDHLDDAKFCQNCGYSLKK
ncbi:MAG: ion transporter [Psychroflexus halocasei]|uniref:ion transporter n=1 Tax=Psychroflexus sp. S27 TaxID=1982757 RepID=UPI000C2B0A61|nr:ion transporter [Psychroflexus sp. S27]PJX20806.1 ion transporter [Psychroflexus sp. S27]